MGKKTLNTGEKTELRRTIYANYTNKSKETKQGAATGEINGEIAEEREGKLGGVGVCVVKHLGRKN